MRVRASFLALSMLVLASTSHEMVLAEPITVIGHNDFERWAACAHFVSPRERRDCYYSYARTKWTIEIFEGPGIPAEPGAEVFVPNALQALQDIVDRCGLGSSYYVRATDGVANLSVGHPDLNPKQIECIRSAERPGLRLRQETN